MAESLEPHDIARRTFDVARRGYEQQEVRGFLHEVSALVERLTRTEREARERAERAEAKLGSSQAPDEAMLLEVLGEETTRVLTSAREAAAEIRSKAEEAAARIIADATTEAAEVRGAAVRDADALMAESKAEADTTLAAARAELDLRRAEAEEAAGRIRADGEADAQRLREQGQSDLTRAKAEAEAVVEAARDEGRAMVAEAQAVRERVLRDLAVRRKRARQQVEKLNAGRERLLEAYAVVRRTADEATDELSTALSDARLAADAAARRIEEEPEPTLEQLDEEVAHAGLVDLPIASHDEADHAGEDDAPGPFSGEVPAVTAAEPQPEAGGEQAAPAPEAGAAEPATGRPVDLDERRGRRRRKRGFEGLPPGELTVLEPPSEEEGVRILAEPAAGSEGEEPPPAGEGATPEEAASGGEPEEAEATEPEEAEAPEEAASGGSLPDAQPVPESEEPPETEGAPSADDVFARLRAEADTEEPAAAPAPELVEPEPDVVEPAAEEEQGAEAEEPETAAEAPEAEEPEVAHLDDAARPFAARRAALESVEKELGRRLKRALADEQNDVLDQLRRAKPKGVDDLLPAVDEHAAAWADVVSPPLGDAAAAGADWSGGTPSSIADLADELARTLTLPLRERIDRSFVASDGNLDDVADRVRALYREWKGQRLAETAAHFAGAAYARGLLDGVPAGTLVQWVVDPDAGPCPDCDDNVLAGALAKGDAFPTGNPCAPAHPGCHCLVLAVSDS